MKKGILKPHKGKQRAAVGEVMVHLARKKERRRTGAPSVSGVDSDDGYVVGAVWYEW